MSSILHLAILWDIGPAIVTIVTSGTTLEVPGFKDQKPLHYAARCLSVTAIDILLQHSADVNSTETKGCTPLDLIITRSWRDATLQVQDKQLRIFLVGEICKHMKEAKTKDVKDLTLAEYGITRFREKRVQAMPISEPQDFSKDLRRLKSSTKELEFMASLIIYGRHVDITNAGERMAISLIKRGADVNSLDVEDTSLLQLAALYG
jgi:hypothetical protein